MGGGEHWWGPGNVGGGSGGLGLCGDDRGREHYSKGLYDNNEQKNFTNAKYNSPFLFLRLNSWMEWLTRRLLKSYKQGRCYDSFHARSRPRPCVRSTPD